MTRLATVAALVAALTDGAVFVPDADRARSLGAGGPLDGVVRDADSLLRRSGQVQRPPRLDDLVNDGSLPERAR